VPNPGGFPNGSAGDPQRRQVEEFLLAFDSNLKPVVGQQTTRTSINAAAVAQRLDDLFFLSRIGDCDLVVKGTVGGQARSWLRVGTGLTDAFQADRGGEPTLTRAQLAALANTPGQELTYTCVPPGSGVRVGLDRDEDGWYDRDELDAGSDPADPASFPSTPTTSVTTTTAPTTTTTTLPLPPNPVLIPTKSLQLRDDNEPPIELKKRRITFRSDTTVYGGPNSIVPPAGGSAGDPRIGGGVLLVYNAGPPSYPTDSVYVQLPAAYWTAIKDDPARGYKFKGPDPVNGPIRNVTVKPHKIAIQGGKANWQYTLDEGLQFAVAVRLALGSEAGWCAYAPRMSGNDTDRVDKFVGRYDAIPTSCPVPKEPSSPSGAFLDETEW
jgi:hypothetical protein